MTQPISESTKLLAEEIAKFLADDEAKVLCISGT